MQAITEQSTMLIMSILNVWIEERFLGIFTGTSATRIVSIAVRDTYLSDANALLQNIIALVNTGDAVVIQELQNEITYQWDEFLDTHNFVLEGEQVAVAEESDSEGEEDLVEVYFELCDECSESPAVLNSIYHLCVGCYHTHELEGSFMCEGEGCVATGHREFFNVCGYCPDCVADAEDTEEEYSDEEEELPMCMVCNTNRSTCRAGDGEEWVYYCVPCRQEDSDDFKKLLSSVEDV